MNYRDSFKEFIHKGLSNDELLKMGAMGLCGEAGEVSELIKKKFYKHGNLDREKLILELGDVRWYLELISYLENISMEEIELKNIQKLSQRYSNE